MLLLMHSYINHEENITHMIQCKYNFKQVIACNPDIVKVISSSSCKHQQENKC